MDTDRIKGAARTSYGRLQEDYGRFAKDDDLIAAGLGQQTAGRTQETFGRAKDSLRDAADRASILAEDAYAQGRRTLERSADAIHDQVETNPVMSILIACAAGYLLGLIVRTRR